MSGRKPLGERAMTPAERQQRRRQKQAAAGEQPAKVAMRILARLSPCEARQVHRELGRLIREAEEERQKDAEGLT